MEQGVFSYISIFADEEFLFSRVLESILAANGPVESLARIRSLSELSEPGGDGGLVIIDADAPITPATDRQPMGDRGWAEILITRPSPSGDSLSPVLAGNARLFITRDSAITPDALRMLRAGFSMVSPEIRISAGNESGQTTSDFNEELTPRQWDILEAMSEGKTNKEIAFDLGISQRTVKFHVSSILRKTGSQSRTEAVVRAMQQGRFGI